MTNPQNLAREILRGLTNYTQAVKGEIEVAKKEVAQELVKELKRKSPKKTGSYRKGWRIKKQGMKYIVHNKTDYQLTHLLEHGHAKRGGGRVEAKVHIAPAEEEAIRDYLDRIERAIEQ